MFVAKGFLKLPKLYTLMKHIKESITCQKLAPCDFWQIGNGKSAKVNLLFLFLNLWNGPEILQFVY